MPHMPTKKRQPVPAPLKHARGTVVRVAGQNGLFQVGSIAEWGGHDNTTVTHYHLTRIGGGRLDRVDAKLITPGSEEDRINAPLEEAARREEHIQQAQLKAHERCREKARARQDALRTRMLADPAKTLRMAQGISRLKSAQCRDLEVLIRWLIPRYRKTHCWKCGNQDLNSLDYPICPACDGLKCRCGGCRCNWPYPPSLRLLIHRDACLPHAP